MNKVTWISFDHHAHCWREDPAGHVLGVWEEERGWVPLFNEEDDGTEENQNG